MARYPGPYTSDKCIYTSNVCLCTNKFVHECCLFIVRLMVRRSFGVLSEPRNRQREDVIPLPQRQLFRNLFQRHGTATATITCSTGKKTQDTGSYGCFGYANATTMFLAAEENTTHKAFRLPADARARARPTPIPCLVNTSENTRGQNEDVGCIIYTSKVHATSPGLHRLFVLRKYYCHFIWALYNINLCV